MKFGDDVLQQWIDKLPEPRVHKKLQNARTSEDTLTELAVGYLFAEVFGYEVVYEEEFNGRTPDWHVHSGGGMLSFYIEVLTRNPSDETAQFLGEALRRRIPSPAYWVKPDLGKKIVEKMNKYRSIVGSGVPFIVGVAASFFSGVDKDDLIKTCLSSDREELFVKRPGLSGVIWIEKIEKARCWELTPLYNPHATNPLPNNAIGLEND